MSESRFLFLTCQIGAENVCKQTLLEACDKLRFAFSRPGCLTFKLIDDETNVLPFIQRNPFARSFGWSLGLLKSEDGNELTKAFWERIQSSLPANVRPRRVHVWERDRSRIGQRGFEPNISPLAESVGAKLLESVPPEIQNSNALDLNKTAFKTEWVLDCVLLEPNEWLVGFHQAVTDVNSWPGGMPDLSIPDDIPSRAYLKMLESLRWSKLPIRKGDTIVEIGSAPGGSVQTLLDKGLRVIGVDPADMDPEVAKHPNFQHWRMRGAEVKRRRLVDVRWLSCDANIPPKQTLDMVESLVTHDSTRFRGLLLTLKMPEWKLADEISNYMARVRSWGFRYVKVRQLVYNRQEICLFALKQKALIRARARKRPDGKRAGTPTDESN